MGDGTRREGDYRGRKGEKRLVLRRERKQFWDRDKCSKVGEADERVIFEWVRRRRTHKF